MDFAQSTNFMGLRDLSVVWITRQTGFPLGQILEILRDEVLGDDTTVLLKDHLFTEPPRFVLDYLICRDSLFTKSEFLFPTVDGQLYHPTKFIKRIRKLLQEANVATSPSDPSQLCDEQYQALLNLRFQLQRPIFQNALAVVLCSYLGLRPSEVARLITTDLDFDNRLIILRQTKSQEDQELPLLSFMIEPFKAYVGHLPRYAPLFINAHRSQWDRRDVTTVVSQWGGGLGVENLTARKMRASLGAMLARLGVPPAMLSKILRHKDPATALRHYNEMEVEDIRRLLENLHRRDFLPNRQTIQDYQQMYDLLEADE
jgi:integrase